MSKRAEEALDLSIGFVGTLLSKLTDAKRHLSVPDKMFVTVDLEGADRAMQQISVMIEEARKELKSKRKKVATGLPLTAAGLVKFDPKYFDYLNPDSENYSEFSHGKVSLPDRDRDRLCRNLATWVYDDGDTKGALADVKTAFGDEVFKTVKQKIRERDHDT